LDKTARKTKGEKSVYHPLLILSTCPFRFPSSFVDSSFKQLRTKEESWMVEGRGTGNREGQAREVDLEEGKRHRKRNGPATVTARTVDVLLFNFFLSFHLPMLIAF
jgi:hypothetical protein